MISSTANPVPRRGPFTDTNGNVARVWIDFLNNLGGDVIVQRIAVDGGVITASSVAKDGMTLIVFVSQGVAPSASDWDTSGDPTGAGAFVNAPAIPEVANATYAALFVGNSDDGKWYGISSSVLQVVGVNVIPKVTAPGELGPSAITDDGTEVTILKRNVGIGISVPGRELDVANTGGTAFIRLTGARAGTTDLAILEAFNTQDAGGEVVAAIGFLKSTGVTGDCAIDLRPGAAGVLSTKARMLPNGNMGFGGNLTPAYPIDVTGDVNVSGAFRVGGVPIAGSSGFPGSYVPAVALTGQTGPISSQNLQHASAVLPAGDYIIFFGAECTATGSATVAVTFGWTSPSGNPHTVTPLSFPLTPLGEYVGGSFPIHTDGVTDLTYSASDSGTGTFSLDITVIRTN